MEDDDIRVGLRSGDVEHAFRALYERHGDAIHRVCLAVLRDPEAADDAAQDTFVKAYKHRDRLAAADSIVGYLLKMARNTAIDAQRRVARRGRLTRAQAPLPTAEIMPGAGVEAEPAELAALSECRDELDPTTRLALDLYSGGIPWRTIADTVDLATDAVRMRVKRALSTLQRCIEAKKVGRS